MGPSTVLSGAVEVRALSTKKETCQLFLKMQNQLTKMVWGHSKLFWRSQRVSKKAEDIQKLVLLSLISLKSSLDWCSRQAARRSVSTVMRT